MEITSLSDSKFIVSHGVSTETSDYYYDGCDTDADNGCTLKKGNADIRLGHIPAWSSEAILNMLPSEIKKSVNYGICGYEWKMYENKYRLHIVRDGDNGWLFRYADENPVHYDELFEISDCVFGKGVIRMFIHLLMNGMIVANYGYRKCMKNKIKEYDDGEVIPYI